MILLGTEIDLVGDDDNGRLVLGAHYLLAQLGHLLKSAGIARVVDEDEDVVLLDREIEHSRELEGARRVEDLEDDLPVLGRVEGGVVRVVDRRLVLVRYRLVEKLIDERRLADLLQAQEHHLDRLAAVRLAMSASSETARVRLCSILIVRVQRICIFYRVIIVMY